MIPLDWKLNLWLGVGIPLAIVELFVVAIFVRPKTNRGFAWWVLPVVALGVVVPGLWKVGLWLFHAAQPALYHFNRATQWLIAYGWIFPVTIAAAALGYFAWRLWRAEERRLLPTEPVLLPAPQEPTQPREQPVQMWSLPADMRQWDSDGLPR